MSHPDEGTIHAWLDGELTVPKAAALERRLTIDPEFAAAVAEARGLIAASSRIVGALDAVPGRVIPGGRAAAPAARRRAAGFHVNPWMGIAAALVLTVGTVVVVWPPTVMDDATLGESGAAPPAPPPPREPPPTPAAVAELGRTADPLAAAGAGAREETRGLADDAERRTLRQRDAFADSGRLQGVVVTSAELRAQKTSAPAAFAPAAPPALPSRNPVAAEAQRMAAPPTTAALSNDARAEFTAMPFLAGCWRVLPPLTADTVLRNPTILARRGDTLVLALTPQRAVAVVLRGDTLRSVVERDNALRSDSIRSAALRSDVPLGGLTARREECPRVP